MKLSQLITFNALLFIGLGIAFAYAAPMMMGMFNIPGLLTGDATDYWQVTAFMRMFGAALFGFGFLLFAVRGVVEQITPEARRGVIFAMLLAHLIGAITAVTQQVSVWSGPAGWVTFGLFLLLTFAYAYFLVRHSNSGNI